MVAAPEPAEFLLLPGAAWAATATLVALAAFALNTWAAVNSKRAAEAAAQTADRSLQLQAASLPVDFKATILGLFDGVDELAFGLPIWIENAAPAPVYIHMVILEAFRFSSHRKRDPWSPITLFSSSPPRLLHLDEYVSARLPDGLRWERDESVSGSVSILYSHATDEEPRSISRPLALRNFRATPHTSTTDGKLPGA